MKERELTQLTELLRTNHALWQKYLEPIINSVGITFVDRLILDNLREDGFATKNDLANQLGMPHQNLTRSLARLEQSGLIVIQKRTGPDLRQIYLSLTRQGKLINDKINADINLAWQQVCRNIPEQELLSFMSILYRMNSNLLDL
ncbi:MarR family winged helix-turn-helix transcriptional regulator [Pseudomonas sp. BGr12]|uniref:MarR family winged helix-turn-helix transcriptional regulator n=1 Tax=unclassified Pseudomonas TaxID=196821 RepID=UPI00177F0C39|nr:MULTISPECIES: winged helix-turn-helix transcriptional regulator [unclassified Pseudomonas]MBD9502262.1 MarR family transcriptional regulator [Pseudomonas sp. PDM17]MBD9577126.1 MarR family transcriptional regulator [Pseudomonas sp. PDM23]MBD9671301.1 MarR family transcriptional regulator [Pseudomonas sp. PDM21]MDL2429048.1 MarR family transcriptional regulator [Pseudomonas sp. BJa5]